MKFDSLEEEYFYEWLLELKRKKVVANIKRSDTIVLANPVVSGSHTLLTAIEYTPDFTFEVLKEDKYFQPAKNLNTSLKARNKQLLVYNTESQRNTCIVEVKPIRDVRGKTTEVNIKRKWAFQVTGLYVELVKVPGSSNTGSHLFKKTFTPKSYLKTKTGKPRKMNYQPTFLK